MDDKVLTLDELKYIFSDRFPRSAARIAEIRLRVEQTQRDLDEMLLAVLFMERLQEQKNMMSN
jgi:hypothetical protein